MFLMTYISSRIYYIFILMKWLLYVNEFQSQFKNAIKLWQCPMSNVQCPTNGDDKSVERIIGAYASKHVVQQQVGLNTLKNHTRLLLHGFCCQCDKSSTTTTTTYQLQLVLYMQYLCTSRFFTNKQQTILQKKVTTPHLMLLC